jgi:hypothetical protein
MISRLFYYNWSLLVSKGKLQFRMKLELEEM